MKTTSCDIRCNDHIQSVEKQLSMFHMNLPMCNVDEMQYQHYWLLSFLLLFLLSSCDALIQYLSPTTSQLITYPAPTFAYLQPSTYGYTIHGNVTTIQPKTCYDMEQHWNGKIVVIKGELR